MALSTAAVAAIIALLVVGSIAMFILVFSTSINYVYAVAQTSVRNIERVIGVKLSIGSITYTNSVLCMNISSDGSKPLVVAQGVLTLLDYISLVTGNRRIVLIPFDRMAISRLFIGNRTVIINERTAIEVLPGAKVEVCMNVSDVDVANPLIAVFSLPIGVKATKVVYLG